MTYFDFWEFEPTRLWSNATSGRYNNPVIVNNSLKESPYHIQAAGFKKSDITAELKNGDLLHIKGESETYGKKSIDFVLVIPDEVDKETIELTVADGIITITFENKREEAKKIKVK